MILSHDLSGSVRRELTVLLHPLGVDHQFWDGLRRSVSLEPCLVPDLPGHGSRTRLRANSIEEYTDIILDDVAQSGTDHVRIIGVSIGGLIGQHIAARYPQLVSKLVLVDTVAAYPEQWATNWQNRAHLALAEGMHSLVEPTLAMWFSEKFRLADELAVRYVHECLIGMSAEGYAQTCMALSAATHEPALAKITADTLVLCGDDDLDLFVAGARYLTSVVGTSHLTMIPGRHGASLESETQFCNEIKRFLT